MICLENGCLMRARYRPIDGDGSVREHQEMEMLGHEDKSDEFDARLLVALIEGPGQPLPPGVIRQQRQTPIAGESQLMKMTWLVDMSNLLAMGHGRSRFGTVAANRSRHWQSQWHPDISTHLTPVPPRRIRVPGQ